jgi:hypothetical protein
LDAVSDALGYCNPSTEQNIKYEMLPNYQKLKLNYYWFLCPIPLTPWDETFPLKSGFPTFEAENWVLGFVQICNKNRGRGLIIQGQRLGLVPRYPATTRACHVQIYDQRRCSFKMVAVAAILYLVPINYLTNAWVNRSDFFVAYWG